MERNLIHYFDSYGCKTVFIVRKDNALMALKKRKFVYVLPEVVEIIDRINRRLSKEVTLEDVSIELCVHPAVIYSIFKYLKRIGLLGEAECLPASEFDRHCILPDNNKKWIGNIYPILRDVKEEDYGPDVKSKKKEKECAA